MERQLSLLRRWPLTQAGRGSISRAQWRSCAVDARPARSSQLPAEHLFRAGTGDARVRDSIAARSRTVVVELAGRLAAPLRASSRLRPLFHVRDALCGAPHLRRDRRSVLVRGAGELSPGAAAGARALARTHRRRSDAHKIVEAPGDVYAPRSRHRSDPFVLRPPADDRRAGRGGSLVALS